MSSVDMIAYITQLEEELSLMRSLVCELTSTIHNTKAQSEQHAIGLTQAHTGIRDITHKSHKPCGNPECQTCAQQYRKCKARCDNPECYECSDSTCDNPECSRCKPKYNSHSD